MGMSDNYLLEKYNIHYDKPKFNSNRNYIIVNDSYIGDLESKIEGYLKKGWVLSGGVSVRNTTHNDATFYQAIYKPQQQENQSIKKFNLSLD